MFSVQQKRDISDAVQKILRATKHSELPTTGEISFNLHVDGAEGWSWADIQNNGAVGDPGINPHNELMASIPAEEGRGLIERAKELTGQSVPEAKDPSFHGATPYLPVSNTPEEFLKEMWTKRMAAVELDVNAHEKRITQLENFLTPIIEDNLIQHHSHQIENLATAIRQLGSPKVTGGD